MIEPEAQDVDLWDYLQDKVGQSQLPAGVVPLTEGEKKVISSIVGQLNRAARQGRYDLAYVASLVQQLAGQGRPEALKWLNLGVKRAKEPLNFRVRNFGCSLYGVDLRQRCSVRRDAWWKQPRG